MIFWCLVSWVLSMTRPSETLRKDGEKRVWPWTKGQMCICTNYTWLLWGHNLRWGFPPHPKKVRTLHASAAPCNISRVRSLLGMVNYCTRFLDDFATANQPLRELTKKNTMDIKLTSGSSGWAESSFVQWFCHDTFWPCQTDWTGGLCKLCWPGCSASTENLTRWTRQCGKLCQQSTVSDWINTRKQNGIPPLCWGVSIFTHFCWAPFTLVSNHKPLEWIFNNLNLWIFTSKPSAHIEHMALCLQPYIYVVCYKSGKDNPAHYMSCHPMHVLQLSLCILGQAEEYGNFVTVNVVPEAMSEIQPQKLTLLLARSSASSPQAYECSHWKTRRGQMELTFLLCCHSEKSKVNSPLLLMGM